MKRFLSILFASAAIGLAAVPAEATLYDRGGGLIYDDDLNITWLQDATYAMTSGYDANGIMTWLEAMSWADNLVYGGYSDWRLPTVVPQNYDEGYDGTDGHGYNITTGSEMGHLFYSELGNLGYQAIDGTSPQLGWGLVNIGPFINFQPHPNSPSHYPYWSGSEDARGTDKAWNFDFNRGFQGDDIKDWEMGYAWAVRDGDVAGATSGDAAPVPEPGTMMLLGSGLAGLVAFRKRFGL